MQIEFRPMQFDDIPLWQQWRALPHVKDVWFIEGYEPADYVYQKIEGNGYDYPFIIYVDGQPIGYIVCCDLYSYRTVCPNPKGNFTQEEPGTFCLDLFIGETDYLNRGYGTEIVKQFSDYLTQAFKAKKILIDPAVSNKRAIRCYEKAGFQFLRESFDDVTMCHVMVKANNDS